MSDFKKRLQAVDKSRFVDIIQPLHVTDVCEKCYAWDESLGIYNQYRCRCMGSCLVETLHPNLIMYLKSKI